MGDLIDLSLVTESRRCLKQMLERRGIAYFLQPAAPRPFQLDASKTELVLRLALKRRDGALPRPTPDAREYARREVRRELIRHVVRAMLQVGL